MNGAAFLVGSLLDGGCDLADGLPGSDDAMFARVVPTARTPAVFSKRRRVHWSAFSRITSNIGHRWYEVYESQILGVVIEALAGPYSLNGLRLEAVRLGLPAILTIVSPRIVKKRGDKSTAASDAGLTFTAQSKIANAGNSGPHRVRRFGR
jgi:hypothetical protein